MQGVPGFQQSIEQLGAGADQALIVIACGVLRQAFWSCSWALQDAKIRFSAMGRQAGDRCG